MLMDGGRTDFAQHDSMPSIGTRYLHVPLLVFLVVVSVGGPLRLSLFLSVAFAVLVAATLLGSGKNRDYSFSDTYLVVLTAFCVLSFAWVMFVSYHSVGVRLVVVTFGSVATLLVIRGSQLPKNSCSQSQLRESHYGVELLLPAVSIVLVGLRGMVPILPLGMALMLVAFAYRASYRRLVLLPCLLVLLGSVLATRQWSTGEPYWFWLAVA